MLYLLTNPHTKQCGYTNLTLKLPLLKLVIALILFHVFLNGLKISMTGLSTTEKTQEIGIYNYIKHSVVRGGAPVNDCIRSELLAVKDRGIIANVYDRLIPFYESTEKRII